MTEKTKISLHASGWTPDRNIDILQIKTDLEAWGYTGNMAADTFLRSFGNLLPKNAEFHFINNEFDFYYDSDYIAAIDEDYNKKLCPIGYYGPEYTGLIMAEDGTVYWVNDGDWGLLADNYIDALNKIFA